MQGYTVISAGVEARRGGAMSPAAVEMLAELSMTPDFIGTTPLTLKEIKGSDLIVCMTDELVKKLTKSYRSANGKTIHIMSQANGKRDVFEPRSTLDAQRQCFAMMKTALDNIAEKFHSNP